MTRSQLANELTLDSQVSNAIQVFAQTLADTSEFRAFEESYGVFKHDRAAQEAVRLFQEKQQSLQMAQQLGTLTPDELTVLNLLRNAMMNQRSVHAYVDAQNELMLLCLAAAQELSATIGLDFASARNEPRRAGVVKPPLVFVGDDQGYLGELLAAGERISGPAIRRRNWYQNRNSILTWQD